MLTRPLPPFRAKPARKTLVPKVPPGESRKDADEISVKARRLPIRFARLTAAPPLRVLSREPA